jgi:hypothetical protein
MPEQTAPTRQKKFRWETTFDLVRRLELGKQKRELAVVRRLDVRETVVRRMLDPNHDTKPEKIQAALEILGKRIVMAYDAA